MKYIKTLFAVVIISVSFGSFMNHVSAAAQPISGIDISAKKNPGGVPSKSMKTNTDGYFTFDNLEAGLYDIYSGSGTSETLLKQVKVDKKKIFGRVTVDILIEAPIPTFFTKGNLSSDQIEVLKAIFDSVGVSDESTVNDMTTGALRKEIMAFQKKNKISATGIISDSTLKKLNSLLEYSGTEDPISDNPPTLAAKKKSGYQILRERGIKCSMCWNNH